MLLNIIQEKYAERFAGLQKDYESRIESFQQNDRQLAMWLEQGVPEHIARKIWADHRATLAREANSARLVSAQLDDMYELELKLALQNLQRRREESSFWWSSTGSEEAST